MKFILILLISAIIAQEEEEFYQNEPTDNHVYVDDDDAAYQKPLHKRVIENSFCMDGSPAVYYGYEGTSDDLILYFYSGGICIQDNSKFQKFGEYSYIDNCTFRNQSFYGSSLNYPDEFHGNQGLMGNSKYQNEHLRTAHKAFLMYCDGNMWFNQMNEKIFLQILKDFKFIPKRIILAGSGVGGLYIIHQNEKLYNIIQQQYNNEIEVKLLLDSVIYDLSGSQDVLDAYQEVGKRINVQVDELFTLNKLAQIQIPTFIVHSQYDWWQLEIINGFDCIGKMHLDKCNPKEKKQIEKIRNSITQDLIKLVKSKQNWGLFAVSCVFNEFVIWTEAWNHPRFQAPMLEGGKLQDNFWDWLNNKQQNHIHYDVVAWPDNKPCANLNYGGQSDPELDDLMRQYELKEQQRKRREKYEDL